MFKRIRAAIAASVLTIVLSIAPVALLGSMVLTQTACPQMQTLTSISHRVVKEVDAALPILRSNNVDVAILLQVRDKAAKAEEAFKRSDGIAGAELVGQLIDIFENDLLAQINRIQNSTTRTVVLVGLYLVNNRLHDLSDKLAEAAPTVPASRSRSATPTAAATRAIATLRTRKRWSCRASGPLEKYKGGQYVPMEFCKKYPDSTQVETR